ncbi:hypothetical protein NC653_001604 [Populus alba x Populus x berolinensis]|uniref:Uncharacterized protein n=1 Tax=Populus alba x Populus x berolinensis TaxID=444605 RepID=A0AAD6WGR8_9ROSI|nr:hypothetical protein NC653_001604 [Populus alba x Populus x berolinensis]
MLDDPQEHSILVFRQEQFYQPSAGCSDRRFRKSRQEQEIFSAEVLSQGSPDSLACCTRFLFWGQAGSCCIGLYKRYLRGPFELINVFLSTNVALNFYKLTELDVSQNQNSDTLNSDLFLKGLGFYQTLEAVLTKRVEPKGAPAVSHLASQRRNMPPPTVILGNTEL